MRKIVLWGSVFLTITLNAGIMLNVPDSRRPDPAVAGDSGSGVSIVVSSKGEKESG